MQDLFDRISGHYKQRLPLACYRKPGANKLTAVFQHDAALHTADFNTAGFVFAPFDGTPLLLPYGQSEIHAADWQATDSDGLHVIETTANPEDFERLVGQGIAAIQDGQFQKVVLSRKEAVAVPDFELVSVFQKLASAYLSAFVYCFYHPKVGLWLGATPEKLLKIETNKFETMALAGTQRFDGTEHVDWAQKEREEQQFVTDFIMENLENVTTDIAFSDPYTYRAGNLLHLKTDISGTLDGASNTGRLVELLHPTPAVCGLPKEAARRFILEHEGYDRKFYSGYLGELYADFYSDGILTDLYVNLRCMEVDGETAYLYVGCGITRESDPQKEFVETVNKSMTIKKVL
ncbi:isochorismate synthase [Flavobacterium caeni]|uniref:isochorismate synthase n=1 Tax=Flavobacterium caeni TaxID=490189 RepID=A0A1G5CGK8_9FLAO|nr:isochorismate synthase [Flavobacterium caeni]SCY01477.1 isochorismate synthase [Flavobacterium caeni]